MAVFVNSVRLDSDRCMGCINCIKRCPTQAIRVRGGKAHIIKPFCIDCGECIRVCPHHAKQATYDPLDVLTKFKYNIALPAPSFYGQFNNLDDTNIVLSALLKMGFDDVYEVSAAAELVSELSRKYIEAHPETKPFISTACPSVVKLIRVRFPNLIEHMLPIKAPIEIAAEQARRRAVEKTGLAPEEIGVIFITPCPAKVTAVHYPLSTQNSEIDAAVAIREVYTKILPFMKEVQDAPDELSHSGKIGISWGASGGEAVGLLTDSYLAADGIENVIKVLEDLEDQKIANLDFIELNACSGGCVGGVLQVENPYVAKAKLKKLRKYMPITKSHVEDNPVGNALWDNHIEYQPVFDLGTNLMESFEKMGTAEEILKRLPGLDCGSCGAPSCRALAEDVVRGVAHEKDCVYLLREYIHKISTDLSGL
ncbi:MAG: [Fe-Fe] hydrogenase large subunit C-terminal domain-containing protein [Oscillospiraceae bacterium]